jgi:hypothetical protein
MGVIAGSSPGRSPLVKFGGYFLDSAILIKICPENGILFFKVPSIVFQAIGISEHVCVFTEDLDDLLLEQNACGTLLCQTPG